jgi:epsilon-lactone hydrolase
METPMRFEIPPTVSAEAKGALGKFYAAVEAYAQSPQPTPVTQEDWDQQSAMIATAFGPMAQANADALCVVVKDDTLGGVPVVRITPPNYRTRARTLIYLHGGAYTAFSARTSLTVPALMAVATGDEIISIDYTLAPRSKWQATTDQIIAAYQTVLATHKAEAIGMLGDSAGGALLAGSVLKLRDQGLALPGALYLLAPWSDITETGDSYVTLADADPTLMSRRLKVSAAAYADPKHQKSPYVSPVYGDYTKAFPPTLIQGGTREIFLSNSVRLYQVIRSGGHQAVLDIYEGMPHVFQAVAPFVPETKIAMGRAAAFFDLHLGKRP